MLLGTRMTNNEPSAITDLDVVARYDATDPNYVIKDSLNRISALLDKSKRLANGVELFANGYNLVDSNSDGLADGFSIFNNVPTTKSIITGNGFPGKAQRVESTNTTVWGLSIGNITTTKVYKLSFYYRSNKQFGINDGIYTYGVLPANNGMAIQKEIIFASSGVRPVYFGFFNELDAYVEVGNITIKEIIGNHIVQLETSKMPIHTNRYNLLTYSEDFSNAVWLKSNGSVQSNQIMSPIGTLTADKFVLNVGAGHIYQFPVGYNKSSSTAISVYLKHGGIDIIRVQISTAGHYMDVNLLNGTKVSSVTESTIESVNNGWYKITMKYNGLPNDSTASPILLVAVPSGSTHLSGDGVYIWGAQLEQSNFAGKYQRINAANDYDTNGFEYYAQFDGVDDYLKSLSFTLNQPTSIYSCLKQNSWTTEDIIYCGNTDSRLILYQNGKSPLIRMYSSGINLNPNNNLATGQFGNIYTLFDTTNSKHKINNTPYITGNIGTSNSDGFTLGAKSNETFASNISVKEIIIKRIATDESDTIFNYFKNKHNVQY